MGDAEVTGKVKLWDWPVRVVHWAFVLLLPSLWWAWKSGDMALHERLGYIMLALVFFRILWGFVGGSTARFLGFVKGPRAVAAYVGKLLGKEGEPVVGHNPLGGWSVIILLALLAAQVCFGLVAQDVDGIESGPLSHYVSYETADAAREWHGLIFNILLGFVALHVCAILFYLIVKRDNLIGPMVIGSKRMAPPAAAPRFASWWRIVPGIVIGFGLAWWISTGAPLPF